MDFILLCLKGMNFSIITFFDLAGTFAFAVSGTISAMHKRFDLFGALFIGFITAIGGGTIRDCMIGNTPVTWLLNINYFYLIFPAVVFTIVFRKIVSYLRTTLFLFDTIGIGVFTVIGIEKSLQADIYPAMAIIMGVISAVAGGILRDVLCNEVPLIFHKEIYATACISGGILFILLLQTPVPKSISIIITISIIIFIRICSVKFKWSLPNLPDNDF